MNKFIHFMVNTILKLFSLEHSLKMVELLHIILALLLHKQILNQPNIESNIQQMSHQHQSQLLIELLLHQSPNLKENSQKDKILRKTWGEKIPMMMIHYKLIELALQ